MNNFVCSILFCLIVAVYSRVPCAPRGFGRDSTVCVCNATYCDDLDPIEKTAKGVITLFETTKAGDRFKETKLKFGDKNAEKATKTHTITIDPSKKFQKIIGFGGSFTDATGLNIAALPAKLQETFIRDYFSKNGIEYNLARVPIAGTDFSTHAYTYADTPNDDELKNFKLASDDHNYKIPFIKAAMKVSTHPVRLFGSPWSSPAWLKDNNNIIHGGFLIGKPGGKQYKIFANYFVKFLDAYKAEGIQFWGLTIENEPKAGNDSKYGFNCLGFTPELQRDFLKSDFGPTLEKAGYGVNNISVMIFDDQRSQILRWAEIILKDKDAAKYVSGTAYHWYENSNENIGNLEKTHQIDPSKYILSTESSEGEISLGYWHPFEKYANDIITNLNHYTTGYVDWNMALDNQYGPSWVGNKANAAIIVNAKDHEYYKQPFFYAQGHFSKFIIPDSVKVQVNENAKLDKLETTVFVRPDNSTVVVALNLGDDTIELNIEDPVEGKVSHVVKPRSIQTYIYFH